MRKVVSLVIALVMLLNVSFGYTLTITYYDEVITREVEANQEIFLGMSERFDVDWFVKTENAILRMLGNQAHFVMPEEDVEVVIRDFDTYLLSFESNGGSEVSPIKVIHSRPYGTLPIPSKEGYNFAGWYTNNEFTTQITSSTIVETENDHTVYAKWLIDAFVITSTAGINGSITPSGSIEVERGTSQTYTITPNIGYKVDYVLVDGENIGNITDYTFSNVLESHTIEVVFVANTFTITLDANGGFYGDVSEISTSFSGQTITLAAGVNVPVSTSSTLSLSANQQYLITFDYWASGNNIFNVDLYPDTLPEINPTASTTKQTYNWILSSESSDMNSCKLRFFNNKVTPNPYNTYIDNIHLYKVTNVSFSSNEIVTYGLPMPSIVIPKRAEYVFLGYFSEPNGGGIQYYSSNGISLRNYDITSDATLYAHWKSVFPTFTYTSSYTTATDEDYWYVYFTNSGTLTLDHSTTVDVFLVGGGGGGAYASNNCHGGCGGGGGYTTTGRDIILPVNNPYDIVVGAGGKGGYSGSAATSGSSSSAFGFTANGGGAGVAYGDGYSGAAGSGGSGGGSKARWGIGGAGGSDGSNGALPDNTGEAGSVGCGQGRTTRAFEEANGPLYAGGGGGGSGLDATTSPSGGAGGGGYGGRKNVSGGAGQANTGGGGGGGSNNSSGGGGGSGIVIIRGSLNPSKITLDNQGGTGLNDIETFYGNSLNDIPIPIRTDYLFLGYYTKPNGEGVQYYNPNGQSDKKYDIVGDITLYAHWYPLIYTYTGSSYATSDNIYWYIYLTSSGNFNLASYTDVDVFLVGGGGGGAYAGNAVHGGCGGGGGYTTTGLGITLVSTNSYDIVVGAGGRGGYSGSAATSGNSSSAFGFTANGGGPGYAQPDAYNGDGWYGTAGNGGSGGGSKARWGTGGVGGSDGSDGALPSNTGEAGVIGKGQGRTTRAFGEANGTLYAGGGGGGNGSGSEYYPRASGGAGGGGAGGNNSSAGGSGQANTGGGGGGGANGLNGGAGGSGVVIIRGLI